ncbi:MAG TPA: hypothetical protein VIM96_07460 [Pseudomonadales bacterium]|jgi:hypothetical protein
MKDLSRIEARLETTLGWLAVPLLAQAVYHINWWPVVLFLVLAMVLERVAERRLRDTERETAL